MGLFDGARGRGAGGAGAVAERWTTPPGRRDLATSSSSPHLAGRRGVRRAADPGDRDDDRAGRRAAMDPPAVDGPDVARRLSRDLAMPVYDAQVTGYPQRMRDWSDRRNGPAGLPAGRPASSAMRSSMVAAACAPGRRCRPWACSPTARRCCNAGPATSMCAQGRPSGTNSAQEVAADKHAAHPVDGGVDEVGDGESRPRRSSAGSGIGHMPSPLRSPAATTRRAGRRCP